MNYLIKKTLALCLCFSLALVIKAQNVKFTTESKIQPFYLADDGGAYFIHVDGNKIRGIGEHPGKNYSISFWGKKKGDVITGKWWCLPKYSSKNHGTIELKLDKNNKLQVINESGGFPVVNLNPKPLTKSILVQLPYTKKPEWEVGTSDNISGAFKSTSKNVICYVRQSGDAVRMYCESMASGDKKPSFAYSFLGRKKEKGKIEGKVYSISKGKQKGSAKATFYIKNENKMTATSTFKLGGDNWKRVHPDYGTKINDYIKGKDNNPGNMLQIVSNPTASPKSMGKADPKNSKSNGGIKQCETQKWSFSKNVIDQTVLKAIDLFPGAIVNIDEKFVTGEPRIITELPQSKRTFSITRLAGFSKGKESFGISKLKLSKYQTQLNNRLSWWRKNSRVAFTPNTGEESSEFSWSKKQFLMNIGVNYLAPSVSVAASVSYEKTSESYVFNAFARYDFYSVLVDQPKSPSDWFLPSTTLKQIKAVHRTKNTRLGYVSKVTYGAVMLVSFEFSSEESFTDISAAVNAVTAGGAIKAELKTKISNALKNVRIKYKVTGGKVTSLDHTGDVDNIIKQYNDIKRNLTKGSDPGQGVPVSYQVKFLKDNELAKIGQATDFEEAKCEVKPDFVSFESSGHFSTVFRLTDAKGDLIGEQKMKKGSKSITLPVNTLFPLTLEIKIRPFAKSLNAKGKWNHFKKITATPGCHYRMGGGSQKKADLQIQECN